MRVFTIYYSGVRGETVKTLNNIDWDEETAGLQADDDVQIVVGEAKDKMLGYKARAKRLGTKMAFLQLQMNIYKKRNYLQAISLAESQAQVASLQALLGGFLPAAAESNPEREVMEIGNE